MEPITIKVIPIDLRNGGDVESQVSEAVSQAIRSEVGGGPETKTSSAYAPEVQAALDQIGPILTGILKVGLTQAGRPAPGRW